MTISNTDFAYITPEALAEKKSVEAWFSLKNRHYASPESRIRGLNLGFNTPDSEIAVSRNRSELLSELNIDPEWVAYADQVHSNRIQLVSEGGNYAAADGLVTTLPGLTLAIQVADCAAVLLWDASNYVIGAFHAGWRGAVAEIIPNGVQLMVRQGADLKQIKAFVSPCISLKNFEVGPEVAEQFPLSFVDEHTYRKPHVDLKGFINSQLEEEGIEGSHIEVRGECTFDEADHFYSYRREGEESGRMMALIRMKK